MVRQWDYGDVPPGTRYLCTSPPPLPLLSPSPPPPLPPFCGRVMRQQRIYSFRRVVFDLCIVSVCEHVKFGKRLQVLGAPILNLGSAYYVDKQLMLLFTCR